MNKLQSMREHQSSHKKIWSLRGTLSIDQSIMSLRGAKRRGNLQIVYSIHLDRQINVILKAGSMNVVNVLGRVVERPH